MYWAASGLKGKTLFGISSAIRSRTLLRVVLSPNLS
jgi:hypothetical protein